MDTKVVVAVKTSISCKLTWNYQCKGNFVKKKKLIVGFYTKTHSNLKRFEDGFKKFYFHLKGCCWPL